MTANFSLIRPLLSFPPDLKDDCFYFLQIIARRKDNPSMEKGEKLIRNYYIYSLDEYDNLIGHIMDHCERNNARAYIRLNRRSARICALQTMKRIADLIISEQYKDVNDIYTSIAGEYHADTDKKWILDIDDDVENVRKRLLDWRFRNNPKSEVDDKIDVVAEIPTVNGIHLLVRPFRLDIFNAEFHDRVAVHKDNPTILYFGGK